MRMQCRSSSSTDTSRLAPHVEDPERVVTADDEIFLGGQRYALADVIREADYDFHTPGAQRRQSGREALQQEHRAVMINGQAVWRVQWADVGDFGVSSVRRHADQSAVASTEPFSPGV